MIDAPSYAVGWQEPVYLPDPVVGAEWSYTVDGRYYERLITAHIVFTASATVADRYPQMQLTDANGVAVTSAPVGSGTAASDVLTADLTLNAPAFSLAQSGGSWGYFPDLLIPPGWTWQSVTYGIDAGDQYSGIVLLVQRFPNDVTSITAGQ